MVHSLTAVAIPGEHLSHVPEVSKSEAGHREVKVAMYIDGHIAINHLLIIMANVHI